MTFIYVFIYVLLGRLYGRALSSGSTEYIHHFAPCVCVCVINFNVKNLF